MLYIVLYEVFQLVLGIEQSDSVNVELMNFVCFLFKPMLIYSRTLQIPVSYMSRSYFVTDYEKATKSPRVSRCCF